MTHPALTWLALAAGTASLLLHLTSAPAAPASPAQQPAAAAESEAPSATQLLARLERLESAGASPRVEADLAALREQITSLQSAVERRAVAPSTVEATASPQATPEPAAGPDTAARAEFADLVTRMVKANFEVPADEMAQFYALAKDGPLLGDHIATLEAAVDAAPDDADARVALADGYVAKLMTVSGAEQAIWGMRATKQWERALQSDPEHWDAHFSLGQSFAYYPDVLNKTGDAIRHLSRARDIQEKLPTDRLGERQAQTYLMLARMQVRRGARDEARATLTRGLGVFPGHAAISRALEEL